MTPPAGARPRGGRGDVRGGLQRPGCPDDGPASVRACAFVREREREPVCVCVLVCVCVSVCERESVCECAKEREGRREREGV